MNELSVEELRSLYLKMDSAHRRSIFRRRVLFGLMLVLVGVASWLVTSVVLNW